jgi:hypothetical protein
MNQVSESDEEKSKIKNREEEIINNIKKILESNIKTGVGMDSIGRIYSEVYPGETIEYEKFGHESLATFILRKLGDFTRIEDTCEGYIVHKMTEDELQRYINYKSSEEAESDRENTKLNDSNAPGNNFNTLKRYS